jgi:hypothetical protein
MALTQEDKNELLNAIKAESQSVDELTEVDSLDGVNSLPAMRGTEVVSVPVSLLSKPATDAASEATAAATTAKKAAVTATEAADKATEATDSAKTVVKRLIEESTTATNNAVDAAKEARSAADAVDAALQNLNAIGDGETIRLAAILDDAQIETVGVNTSGGDFVYIKSLHAFAYRLGAKYYNSWSDDITPNMDDFGSNDRLYLCGTSVYAWNDDGELEEVSGTGGGNTINATELYGTNTLADSIQAVEEKLRQIGRCITYANEQGTWETKQFEGTDVSSWENESAWTDYGGGGTVKTLTVNGEKKTPDASGNVNIVVDSVEVDSSLSASSTNPVENRVVTAKMTELEAGTLFDSEVVENDDDTVTVHLNGKSSEILQFTIPAGRGGSGDTDSTTAKIVLSASVDKTTIKDGSEAILTYTYDHQYTSGDEKGESTGQKASITIEVKRGAITVYSATTSDVSRGTYTFDLSKYLQEGTTDIYVKASAIDPTTGKTQSKQSYASVTVVSLSLSSSYNLVNSIANGGYGESETVSIPYAVNGKGDKIVSLYLDGVQTDSATVKRSGTTNGSFNIPMSGMAVGRHTVQLVAEMETDGLTLSSESIYIDIFKRGATYPLIATMHTFGDGRVFTTNHQTPELEVGQYEQLSFVYAVYDPSVTPANVEIYRNGDKVQSVSVPRSLQTYTNRFTEQGGNEMKLVCGTTQYELSINVSGSVIDVSEAAYGMVMKLSASGRSNAEENPAQWSSNGVETTFENVDWKTSGWTGETLKLMNGASAKIEYQPFATDASTTGCTIEMELKVSNIIDKESRVVSCMDGTKGFEITADKAMMYTGSTKQVTDDDGGVTEQKVGVGRQYSEDEWQKISFVVGKRSDGRLMELYVNGSRVAADIYGDTDNFVQTTPQGIKIESDGANVEVRNVKAYNRALSDDENTDNYIVDRTTIEEMAQLFEKNDVLSDDGTSIDFNKLKAKGKALMLIVRKDGLDPVNAENNKSTDFLADVHLWLPDGRYVYLKNVYIRIQGTSSTKYPSKNYRIYCAKGQDPEMYIDGVKQTTLKLELVPGQKKVKVLCAKSDYSDSSMSQNTGGAKVWNDMMQSLGYLTPPQQYDKTVRTSVYGYPIDVFSAESLEDTPEYYGQYNLNHDKSDWYDIIGMTGVDGFSPECPIALEFLNNTEPLCLFQGKADISAQFESEMGNAVEFNYPKDMTWSTADDKRKTALIRLWEWVRDCVPANATPDDISTFVSSKFKKEVSDYICLEFLLCWYLFTDYNLMVDQRVKNTIWATWDAVIWYLIYYDGDTQHGDRNDSMLAYLYNVMRGTWDSEKSKYAFEGYESWLWCLVLANLSDELKDMAAKMREKLTEEKIYEVFDDEQKGNWCERVYNKSGEKKYILPQTQGVNVNGQTVKYPYIYALKGDKQAFRHWFIKNRFALLDAKYETGQYLSDNIDMYLTRSSSAEANSMEITVNEQAYIGYGTNNAPHLQPSVEAQDGETVTLRFANAFTVNDPIRVYGASKIQILDMRGVADNVTGDINLNKCTVLRSIDLSTSSSGSSGWCLVLDKCLQLTNINLYGQVNAKTGTLSSTELDFSNQTRLQYLDARGVNVQAVLFAPGAPVVSAMLGSTIQTLRLESLPLLTMDGLSVGNYSTIKTLRYSNCPNIDWVEILAQCSNVERVRIEGIDVEDDGTLLNRYKNLKGIDADGNAVDYCAMTGIVRLTKYVDDEEYAMLQERYQELTIKQPEYTMIEFDSNVSDDKNGSNLDNETGYKFGNDYQPSGHITAILKKRHRVLAKVTKKATSVHVTMGGTETTMNNKDGEMTYFPLHDENSNYYADSEDLASCTPAKLDSTEGDFMMYEPGMWKKGINDYLNGKLYSCYSSNDENNKPAIPNATVLTLDDIKNKSGYLSGQKIMSGKETLQASYSTDSSYAVCQVDVVDYKRVRFPTVPGTNLVGSVFCDASGAVIESVVVPSLSSKFEPGMYLVKDVPEGAVMLCFTILKTAEFDKVVLTNSSKIEDIEPEWYWDEEHLCAVVGSTVVGSKLRACVSGGTTAASMSWTDFHYYSVARGMQQIDAMMHSRIANLSYAKYGRRDIQSQCGGGSHSYTRTTGGTVSHGMTDTIGYEIAVNYNSGITKSVIDNVVYQYAWYKETDSLGNYTVKQINNICALGYEDIYGHKYDMMDNVDLPNDSGNVGKWRIFMPDGTVRMVKGMTNSGWWITAVAHGLYMDVIPVGSVNGTSNTYYCDYYWMSTSTGRVVYRGNSYAYASGGVSCTSANVDASSAGTNVGSRLAFRGKIVKAESVAAFKAIEEAA